MVGNFLKLSELEFLELKNLTGFKKFLKFNKFEFRQTKKAGASYETPAFRSCSRSLLYSRWPTDNA
jgi:hypothetical protein